MKIKILSVILFFTLSGCTQQPIVTQMTGKCYEKAAEHEDESGKYYTEQILCLDDKKAYTRMYFSNHDKLSTVCYQTGTITVTPEYLADIKLRGGLCENGKGFKSYEALCSLHNDLSLRCKNTDGELRFDYIFNNYAYPD